MHIETGMIAPNFEVEDIFGNTIRLEDYRGKRLLLGLFRFSACALCNLRIHQMIEHYPAWQKAGLEVIAVFESPLENMREYVGKQDAPFPLVADPESKLYSLYGTEVSEEKVKATMGRSDMKDVVSAAAQAGFALTKEEGSNFYRMPAEFLIGPDLRVQQTHYADYVYDHLPFEVIDQFLGLAVAK